jgi:hypothetical protein
MDRIPNQLIASQSFLGAGWGWGANILSNSPNLARCAFQTSSMQHRDFATRWSEARRLPPRGPRHSQAPRGVREQNGFGLFVVDLASPVAAEDGVVLNIMYFRLDCKL